MMLSSPTQIVNPFAARRVHGYGTGMGGGGTADVTPGVFDYQRPDGTSYYLRPDGTSYFTRP